MRNASGPYCFSCHYCRDSPDRSQEPCCTNSCLTIPCSVQPFAKVTRCPDIRPAMTFAAADNRLIGGTLNRPAVRQRAAKPETLRGPPRRKSFSLSNLPAICGSCAARNKKTGSKVEIFPDLPLQGNLSVALACSKDQSKPRLSARCDRPRAAFSVPA
jgi:hypothetical protein